MKNLLVVLLTSAMLAGAASAAPDGEQLFVNAKVFTADSARPYAEAVAIRDGRVVAVGSRLEASAALGADAEIVDLRGRFMMPGLVDSHCHAVIGGLDLISADNEDRAQSVDELAAFVADAQSSGRGMFGNVLPITGVPLAMWTRVDELGKRFDADAYASQPVALFGMDGHTAWVNTAMRSLAGIEVARRTNGDSGVLHSITHLQFIRPEDMTRFRELGVLASFQLYWARGSNTTIDLVEPYVEPSLYRWQYPARSMLDAGATIAGGSDWNVSTANVFHAIYRAETRNGPKGVLDPDQRVPRVAMLYAYTLEAAKLLGEDGRLGSITPGKLADLVVLDRDVLTVNAEDARDTNVLWTIVGGETVFGAAPAD